MHETRRKRVYKAVVLETSVMRLLFRQRLYSIIVVVVVVVKPAMARTYM